MKTHIALVLAPLVLAAIAFTSNSVLLWRLFFVCIALWSLALVWAFITARRIRVHSSRLAETCHAGEKLKQEVTVVNDSRLPRLMVELQTETNLPGPPGPVAINLSGHASQSWQHLVSCTKRGIYSVGPFTLRISDPFGIITIQRKEGKGGSLLVYPATRMLPHFIPFSRLDSGYSPNRWLAAGISSEAGRIREYTAGDSLNRIHWRSTAHSGTLMVKVFDPYRSSKTSRTAWLLVDMNRESHAGVASDSTEENCIMTAASILKKFIDAGIPTGIIADGEPPCRFAPDNSSQYYWQAMKALALVRVNSSPPVEQLISQETRHFGQNTLVIIITPSVNMQVAATIRHLNSRGSAVVVIIMDSSGFSDHASPVQTIHSIISSGAQVYIVRRGEDLAEALDSRLSLMN